MSLFLFKVLALFLLNTSSNASPTQSRRHCRFGDTCWPDESTWQAFNHSISGRLVRTYPAAAVCHGQTYDAVECKVAKAKWDNSFWRTNQTGAYTAMAWELGNGQCFINSSRNDACQPGLGRTSRTQLVRPEIGADELDSPSLLGNCHFCC